MTISFTKFAFVIPCELVATYQRKYMIFAFWRMLMKKLDMIMIIAQPIELML